MGKTGNVSSCVFYQSEQAQMLRGHRKKLQGGSNMTGTDMYVNKPHCAAVVRP